MFCNKPNWTALLITGTALVLYAGRFAAPYYIARYRGVGANLQGAFLVGAHLDGANLSHANLGGAKMRDAHLQSTNLEGAILREARLSGANLGGADLGFCDMRGADLRQANLCGAELSGVFLNGARLQGADLSRVGALSPGVSWTWTDDVTFRQLDLSPNLTDAVYDSATRWPVGCDPQEYGAVLVK